jgi:hypothetical protein
VADLPRASSSPLRAHLAQLQRLTTELEAVRERVLFHLRQAVTDSQSPGEPETNLRAYFHELGVPQELIEAAIATTR